MPFSEFQPGNAGLALPQFEFQSAMQTRESTFSMMDRAQRLGMDKQKLEIEKQQLASTLAVNSANIDHMRAGIAQATASTENMTLQNNILRASSKMQISALQKAQKLFGTDTDSSFGMSSLPTYGGSPSGSGVPSYLARKEQSGSEFEQDVAPLWSMPLNTPQDVADFKAKLAVVNGKYSAMAEVHPSVKQMFDAALKPLAGKMEGAVTTLTTRAQFQGQALYPDLLAVTNKEQFDSFSAKHADKIRTAMFDPKFAETFSSTAKDVRDKQAALDNAVEVSKASHAATQKNAMEMRKLNNTVDFPEFGISGVAATETDAKNVREAIANYGPSVDAIKGLKNLMSRAEKDVTVKASPKARGEADVLVQQLVSAIGRLQTGKALSEGEATTMKGLVPNPTDIIQFDSKTAAKLESLENELNVRLRYMARSAGLSFAEAGKPPPVTSGAGLRAALNGGAPEQK
jgi:hypothetical protein